MDTDYGRETFGANAELGIPPRFPFWGNVGTRYEKNFLTDGDSEKQDDTIEVFPDLAGLGPQQELWGPYANLVLDLTDAPLHPTVGIKVKGRGALYRSVDDQNFNFYTYGGEVQGHLPLGTERFILSARAGFDTAEPENEDDQIPFVYLPSLGGSERLRGFSTWRFMDRTAAYGSLEYRYRIWQENTPDPETASVIETALFYDVGGVEEELEDVGWTDENSYGLEFRAYITDKHAARVGLARSDEGTQLHLKFSDIY